MQLEQMNLEQLQNEEKNLLSTHQQFLDSSLKLDLTRGKPSAEQLSLSEGMEGLLAGKMIHEDGTDLRNYGGANGIPEARQLGADMLGLTADEVMVGDHTSLTLMYLYLLHAYYHGVQGAETAWVKEGQVKFICLVPGYDRHFTICEELGIEMINVSFLEDGPDLKQIEALVLNGIKEVVLTGVDITSWGLDFEKKERLGDLICFILNSIPSLERLRISSIDSIEIDPRLMDLLCYETRLMPHLHLSLQSGDNMILKRMKRRHSREDTIKFCSLLKKIRPKMTFSADIIAGFPTENEEMFQNTISIIEQCKIDWIHVFPYSSRTGTPASKMPQVPKMEIDKRASILRKISNERLNKHLKNKITIIQKVLVEGNAKGFTEDYSRVSFEEGPEIGEIINMKIEKKYNNELFGIPIN